MIDTVVLLVPIEKTIALDMRSRSVKGWDIQQKNSRYTKYVRNPSKLQKESGKYYPRMDAYKRADRPDYYIRVEFSVPKLLFGNNLDELQETDFESVVTTLKERMFDMGLVVKPEVLKTSELSTIHYSKNIRLRHGYTATSIITELNKIDTRKSFDKTSRTFTNDGQIFYLHSKAHQYVVYDKIADLGKKKKRAVDKDIAPSQQSLFESIQTEHIGLEILRFEVRLNDKRKLRSVLTKVETSDSLTFKSLFKKDTAQRILEHYWKTLIKEKNAGIFTIQTTAKDVLQKLLKIRKLKPKQAVYLTGLVMLAKDGNGVRELRSILSKHSDDRTWYRTSKDIKETTTELAEKQIRDWVSLIDEAFSDYKPYKLKDY